MDSQLKPLFLNYFQRVVGPWEEDDKPAFKAMKRITKEFISLYIYPTGPNAWLWKLVSITGAEEHPIEPVNAPFLVYLWGGYGSYDAHTDTAGHYGGTGEVVDGEIRKSLHVDHPGFKARNFEKHIARWGKQKATKILENALRRGVRKAKANPMPV